MRKFRKMFSEYGPLQWQIEHHDFCNQPIRSLVTQCGWTVIFWEYVVCVYTWTVCWVGVGEVLVSDLSTDGLISFISEAQNSNSFTLIINIYDAWFYSCLFMEAWFCCSIGFSLIICMAKWTDMQGIEQASRCAETSFFLIDCDFLQSGVPGETRLSCRGNNQNSHHSDAQVTCCKGLS